MSSQDGDPLRSSTRKCTQRPQYVDPPWPAGDAGERDLGKNEKPESLPYSIPTFSTLLSTFYTILYLIPGAAAMSWAVQVQAALQSTLI